LRDWRYSPQSAAPYAAGNAARIAAAKVALRRLGWAGNNVGFYPFPTSVTAES